MQSNTILGYGKQIFKEYMPWHKIQVTVISRKDSENTFMKRINSR